MRDVGRDQGDVHALPMTPAIYEEASLAGNMYARQSWLPLLRRYGAPIPLLIRNHRKGFLRVLLKTIASSIPLGAQRACP